MINRFKFYRRQIVALILLVCSCIINFKYQNVFNRTHRKNVYKYLILVSIHRLEKGLSYTNSKGAFGERKAENLVNYLIEYQKIIGHSPEIINLAIELLKAYLESQEKYLHHSTRELLNQYIDNNPTHLLDTGLRKPGVLFIHRPAFGINEVDTLERIIKSRHAIRSFDDTDLSKDRLEKAIMLALQCPTACNRQPVKVYLVDSHDKQTIEKFFNIGGAEKSAKAILICTVDISAFDVIDQQQWLVNGGIFAGYLSITLQAYSIGACIIQRQAIRTRKNRNISKVIGIPNNEQVFLSVLVGNIKKEDYVPSSVRLNPRNFLIYRH